jgi:hypothetical protein
MCYAVVEVRYSVDKGAPALKKIETKEALAREIKSLEQLGTVSQITVFLNHHKHKLVSQWTDELYKEPEAEAAPEKVVDKVKVGE